MTFGRRLLQDAYQLRFQLRRSAVILPSQASCDLLANFLLPFLG